MTVTPTPTPTPVSTAKVDIRTYFERRRGWWIEERCPISNCLPKDGLLVFFRRVDIEPLLDAKYPFCKGDFNQKVWYFNETRDREIAEVDADGRVSCNPQILWELFPQTAGASK
jgi:hypothetical protein